MALIDEAEVRFLRRLVQRRQDVGEERRTRRRGRYYNLRQQSAECLLYPLILNNIKEFS